MSILIVLAQGLAPLAISSAHADELKPGGVNYYEKVTGDDPEDDRRRWDELFNVKGYVFGKEPAAFLKENVDRLPVGRALDIATGEGRNAVYLAKKGFRVDAVDLSEVALRKARRLAHDNGVAITTVNADLNHYEIRPEFYDVILNIDYLQRSLIPGIKRGLRHGGVVVFQNDTVEQLKNAPDQQLRRDSLLGEGELKNLFRDFKILVYCEKNDGKEARAELIARKP